MQKVTQKTWSHKLLTCLPSLPIPPSLYFSLTTSQWKNFHFALSQQQQNSSSSGSTSKKNNARTTRSSQSENIWAKSDSVKAAADQIVRQAALWLSNPPTHLTSLHHNMADWFNNRCGGGVCENWQLVTLVTTFSMLARFVFIFRTWRRRRRRRWWKAKHTVTVTTTTVAQCSGRQSDEQFTY